VVDGMVARGVAARSGIRREGRSPASLPGVPGCVVCGEPLPGGSHRPEALRALETCDLRGTAGLRGVSGAAPHPAPPVPNIRRYDSRAGTRMSTEARQTKAQTKAKGLTGRRGRDQGQAQGDGALDGAPDQAVAGRHARQQPLPAQVYRAWRVVSQGK